MINHIFKNDENLRAKSYYLNVFLTCSFLYMYTEGKLSLDHGATVSFFLKILDSHTIEGFFHHRRGVLLVKSGNARVV